MTDATSDSTANADQPDLADARQNPWYVLMTVAGEQAEDALWFLYNEELHAQNRRYFNGWMAAGLSEEAKARLIDSGWATQADFAKGGHLAPLTDDDHANIEAAWADRCPDAAPLRKTDVQVKLAESALDRALICRGFLFSSVASFRGTTFSSVVNFQGTTFSGVADFHGTTFSGGAFFQGTTFSSGAYFEGTIFSRVANFQGTTFSDYADFQGTTFSSGADYSDSKFESRTLFSPIRQEDTADRPVIFQTKPPRFFNAKLHEDTDFTDVVWPPVPDSREWAIEHRRAYERLKLLMDSQKKTADEHMFHRLEMRCREVELTDLEERTWAQWGTLQAHRAFSSWSDYGWNLARPAAGLMILVVIGWAAIFMAEFWDYRLGDWPNPEQTPKEYLGVFQSGALSLSNVFGFLGLSRTFLAEEIQTLTTVSEIVSAMQTVAGLVLFFLLGLALRNRFRLK